MRHWTEMFANGYGHEKTYARAFSFFAFDAPQPLYTIHVYTQ
jgi:hypothetical protein